MDTASATHDGFTLVGADHTMIWLGDPDADWPSPQAETQPLEPYPPAGLYLFTGTHTGLVGKRMAFHDSHPELDEAEWPDHQIVTVDLDSSDFFAIPTGGLGQLVELALPRPGVYHVRAAWRERPGHNDDPDTMRERYLIDLWPAG